MKERGTTGAGRPQITGVPRLHRHLKRTYGRGTGNVVPLGQTSGIRPVDTQWNSPVDTTISDPQQYGDGRSEVIPSFDGTNFRQYERQVRLFVSNTQVAPERRAVKLLERLEGRAFESCEGMRDLNTPNCVENLLDHLRIHFESIEVFRRGRVVDDFVCERQPGEEIKPLRDATLMATRQARALRGSVPMHQKQSGAYSAQVVVEAQDEEDEGELVLKENEAPDDELEVEYQEDCSSKLVGELCTVSCVSGESNSVDLRQIFLRESNESLSHIFGPEKFRCGCVLLCGELGQLRCQ